MVTLMFRDGSSFTGSASFDAKGRPFVTIVEKCCRCGGDGVWKGSFKGTCYRCGGHGHAPVDVRDHKLYTAEQLVKLNAAQAKAQAKRESKAQAQSDAFDAQHPVLAAAGSLVDAHYMLTSLLNKGRHFGSLSEKQLELADRLIVEDVARREREQALAAAKEAERATSVHVGTLGARVSFAVTCTKVASYERASFRGYGVERVYICTFVTADGAVLVTKTPSLSVEKDARGTLTGTVKTHDHYDGVAQTQLQRAKFVE